MPAKLDADDIARITATVLEKLGDHRIDPAALSEAVQSAAIREEAAPDVPAAASARPELPGASHDRKRIIVASFGLNRPGIVAAISAVLAENSCSIEDMSQRIMQEFYTLIMIVDISGCSTDFAALNDRLKAVEEKLGVTIFVQHEDVFRYMHRV